MHGVSSAKIPFGELKIHNQPVTPDVLGTHVFFPSLTLTIANSLFHQTTRALTHSFTVKDVKDLSACR